MPIIATRFKRCERKSGMRCISPHDSNAAACRRTTEYPPHFHFLAASHECTWKSHVAFCCLPKHPEFTDFFSFYSCEPQVRVVASFLAISTFVLLPRLPNAPAPITCFSY